MAVNVSPRQLSDPNFVNVVSEALMRAHIPAKQLWLEVTEGVMIAQPDQALVTLTKLCELGVRVAIDDFGTGYSSLSLLQKFPIQRLKIDRSFISGVADNDDARALVRTIIAMCDSMGLDMVAEGVESVRQLQALGEMRCAKAQGYLISHPVPPESIASTVAAINDLDHGREHAVSSRDTDARAKPSALRKVRNGCSRLRRSRPVGPPQPHD